MRARHPVGFIMNGSELFTRLRSIVGSRFSRALQRTGLLGALCALILLVSCGKSSELVSPSQNSPRATSASAITTQSLVKVTAFAVSDLDLIHSTSGSNGWVTILSAPITGTNKGVVYVSTSLEAGLFTQGLIRSKNNKKDTSTSSVAIQVQVLVDGTPMPPGVVTYAARTQTMSSTLEGAIGGCSSIVTNPDGTQSIVLDQNCVTPEESETILSTLEAASFNFVASGVPAGDHTISVQARISSSTSVEQGTATATALVGKGSMVAQIFDSK